ncbi:MAG: hypothetical protein H6741_29685 [Alphaproteobacteria bacterium]|nr:hypothetical protein [Alphaproteobacteria bacterium]MCB9796894.1 hypothetical protein [Alphaproteobacteria bacterium]
MRPHDLLFALACVAATAHVAWLVTRGGLLDGGVQAPLADSLSYEADAELLAAALAEARAGGGSGLPDVLLITLSGVRADRFPVEGGRVEAWAAQARALPGLRSTAPYAEAALGSLATGVLPDEHGAVRTRVGAQRPLSPARPTLAERLSEAGWLSVSISGHRELGALQLDRGFAVALDAELNTRGTNLPYVAGDRVTELALAALTARGEAPIFLQLDYADAELPWLLRQGACDAPVPLPGALPPGGFLHKRADWARIQRVLLEGQREARPKELETWSIAYGSELCYLDAQLGRLLEEGAGLGPEDLVVVVALQGAGLGEGGALGTGRSLREDLLAAPAWVRGDAELGAPTSLDALPDALLTALGLEPLPPAARPAPEGLRVAELHGPSEEDVAALRRRSTATPMRAFREDDRVFVVRADKRHELWRQVDGVWVNTNEDAGALGEAALAWTAAAAAAPGGVK